MLLPASALLPDLLWLLPEIKINRNKQLHAIVIKSLQHEYGLWTFSSGSGFKTTWFLPQSHQYIQSAFDNKYERFINNAFSGNYIGSLEQHVRFPTASSNTPIHINPCSVCWTIFALRSDDFSAGKKNVFEGFVVLTGPWGWVVLFRLPPKGDQAQWKTKKACGWWWRRGGGVWKAIRRWWGRQWRRQRQVWRGRKWIWKQRRRGTE